MCLCVVCYAVVARFKERNGIMVVIKDKDSGIEVSVPCCGGGDGMARFPTRCNDVYCGEHLNPCGLRGGLRGVSAVVVRD